MAKKVLLAKGNIRREFGERASKMAIEFLGWVEVHPPIVPEELTRVKPPEITKPVKLIKPPIETVVAKVEDPKPEKVVEIEKPKRTRKKKS